jgi:hypothetical protein
MKSLYFLNYSLENFDQTIVLFPSKNVSSLETIFNELLKTKSKEKVYIFTFNLNKFFTLFQNLGLDSFKHKIFQHNNIIYLLEITDILIPRKKLIIKDAYNFLGPLYLDNKPFSQRIASLYILIHEVNKEFQIDINTRYILSTPSIAFKIFKKLFAKQYKTIPTLTYKVDSYIRKSFIGGRNEVYKPAYLRDNFYYDVNSLYPFIMKTKKFPIGKPQYTKEDAFSKDAAGAYDITDLHGFLDVLVGINKENDVLPVLPYRLENLTPSNSAALGIIYPLGVFRGVYFSEELKYAVENGYKILKIFSGYLYKEISFVFTDFVTLLYEKRIKSNSLLLTSFYKKLLNSMYGRFALSFEDLSGTALNEIDPSLILSKDPMFISLTFKRRYNNIAIASAIASYSRIYMHQTIITNELNVLYLDTDGIFVAKPLPNHLLSESKELGKFRLISQNTEAYFIANKFYIYKPLDQAYKAVFRGVPLNVTISDHSEFLETYKKVLLNSWSSKSFIFRFHGLINNEIKLFCFKFNKKRKYIYNRKRNIIKTEPWIILDT